MAVLPFQLITTLICLVLAACCTTPKLTPSTTPVEAFTVKVEVPSSEKVVAKGFTPACCIPPLVVELFQPQVCL